MARNIYCPSCDARMKKLAFQYGELYESLEGNAIKNMQCDGDGEDIKYGDTCFAAVLLPDDKHFNYARQKPEVWAHDFITTNK